MSTSTANPPWSDTQKSLLAILASVLINLLVLYVIGWWLLIEAGLQPAYPEKKEPELNEVVVSLEDLLPEIVETETAEDKTKSYLETYQNQETEAAPENALFESDRNTKAMTEKLAVNPVDGAVPTQDGDDIPVLETQDHNFVDGPDKEISQSTDAAAGAPATPQTMPQPPSPDTTSPQIVESPPVETTEAPTENADPEAEDPLDEPAESTMAEGKPTELDVDEAGGAPDPVEMAKVDMPTRQDAFSDALDTLDETMVAETDVEDAMPEKNPEELKKRLRPFAASPEAKPNPLQVPTPFMKPQETTVPVPEGSMPSRQTNGQSDEAAFSPERHRNRMSGTLDSLGRTSSFDVERTPLGEYKKLVNRAVERRWHLLKEQYATFISFGSLKLSFDVDRSGKVSNLRILHDDANHTVTTFSQQAVLTADIPPMPAEIVELMGDQKLEVTYKIIIY